MATGRQRVIRCAALVLVIVTVNLVWPYGTSA